MAVSPYTVRPPVSPEDPFGLFKDQLSLLPATLEDAFNTFHAENPRVYRLLLHFTLEVKARGFEHYSIDAIFQRARWHADIETEDSEGFKLNDHHRAYYSRLLNQEPGLEGFFRIRELRSVV